MEELFKAVKEDHFDKLRNTILKSNKYHLEGDTWTHTCLTMNTTNDKFMKMIGLLHDLGKPRAKFEKDNKTMYSGHEGISVYEALKYKNMLLKLLNNDLGKFIELLYVINYHGMFWQKSERQIKKYFANDIDLYNLIYEFSLYDQKGNIFFGNENNRKNKDRIENFDNINIKNKDNNCYIMIGTPLSGKSTYIKENLKGLDVLSRDDILLNYGKEKYSIKDYSNIWNNLTNEDQKEIEVLLLKRFNELKNSNEDFVVDVTNMSWKSRRRWLTQLKNHNPIAIVCLADFGTLFERNIKRNELEGKFIPKNVLMGMMKNLELPLYGEKFTDIKIIFN